MNSTGPGHPRYGSDGKGASIDRASTEFAHVAGPTTQRRRRRIKAHAPFRHPDCPRTITCVSPPRRQAHRRVTNGKDYPRSTPKEWGSARDLAGTQELIARF